jgi:hypothetical protein
MRHWYSIAMNRQAIGVLCRLINRHVGKLSYPHHACCRIIPHELCAATEPQFRRRLIAVSFLSQRVSIRLPGNI